MTQSEKARDHVARYQASNGADGHLWDRLGAPGTYPCLLLTTTGRKSLTPRITPLVYGRDGDSYMVIASQGGRPTHPAWYLNLVVNPEVDLQVGADVFPALAHIAVGEERVRRWTMMKPVYPLYDDYVAKVGKAREIPLVVMTPR